MSMRQKGEKRVKDSMEREKVFERLKETHTGETICLSDEQAMTLVDLIDELEKGEIEE